VSRHAGARPRAAADPRGTAPARRRRRPRRRGAGPPRGSPGSRSRAACVAGDSGRPSHPAARACKAGALSPNIAAFRPNRSWPPSGPATTATERPMSSSQREPTRRLSTSELREAFLDYFRSQGHASAIEPACAPATDPATRLGSPRPACVSRRVRAGATRRRARSLRARGRQANDLENVATRRATTTFFECSALQLRRQSSARRRSLRPGSS